MLMLCLQIMTITRVKGLTCVLLVKPKSLSYAYIPCAKYILISLNFKTIDLLIRTRAMCLEHKTNVSI